MFNSLKSKIAVPIIAVLVFMVVVIVVYASWTTNDLAGSLAQERLDMSFRVASEQFDDIRERTQIVCTAVGNDYVVTTALRRWGDGINLDRIRENLITHLSAVAERYNIDSFVLRDAEGAIILRVHEPGLFGDTDNSLASQAAFRGEATTSFTTTNTLPMGQNATVPIFHNGEVIGNLTALFFLHTEEFVDSFAQLFDAEVSIYNGDTRVMTTLREGGRRAVNVQLDDEQISQAVLVEGRSETVETQSLGKNYNALYFPLKNLAGTTIGMFTVMFPIDDISNAVLTQRLGLIVIGIICLAASALLMIFMIRRSLQPLNNITKSVKEIAAGNMNVNMSAFVSNDEIGALSDSIVTMADTVREMIHDLEGLESEIHVKGEVDYRINAAKYGGSFKRITESINSFVDTYIAEIDMILGVLAEIGAGNFDAHHPALPGKKIETSEKVDAVMLNIKGISADIENLALAAAGGDLNVKADAAKYSGGWARLLTELNDLVKSIADKAYWYESILDAIPMPVSVTDTGMRWTFVNKATEGYLGKTRQEVAGQPCSNWGTAICNTGNCGIVCYKRGIAQTNFSQGGKEFQVNITPLKDVTGNEIGYIEIVQDITALQSLIDKMNGIIENVKSVSKLVAGGANQISQNSMNLAQGASTQASAAEELNASIDIINQQIQNAAQNAGNAKAMSANAIQHATEGSEEMNKMLDAMDRIKESSGNIANIIKKIQDIAFQTNLLALNASVEAARAGEHGRGFTVVADEVRTLAVRTQDAARETSELITDSINKVEEGTHIAAKTATTFEIIVSDFENVSKVINEIAAASSEQADSISQASVGIAQIADIAQSNSALSQEAASASQELASQSDTLMGIVSN